MKEFVCIECPKGCRLKVDDDMNVTGNTCPRGKVYAINEMTCPKRVITSTVVIESKLAPSAVFEEGKFTEIAGRMANVVETKKNKIN